MATSREAYVDTSALIAFVDRSDVHHALLAKLFIGSGTLVTTTLVLAEGHAWFLRRYGRKRALEFLALLQLLKPLNIMSIGPDEYRGGIQYLSKFADQELTLVDAVGLHVMQVRRCDDCWSTDFHLGLTGVPLAIHTA